MELNMNKKLSMILAGVASAALLSACGGTPTSQNSGSDQQQQSSVNIYAPDDCYWKDASKGAPIWSCNFIPSDDNFALFAVGIARSSKYDMSLSRNEATADAQSKLQGQIEAKVEQGFKKASLSTGAAGSEDETLDTAQKQVLNSIVKGTVKNTRRVKETTGPDGYTYVLFGVAKQGMDDLIGQSVKSSLGNEKAQYQMFLAEKIQDEFDKEFDDYQKNNKP
jgi:hypothetical protein